MFFDWRDSILKLQEEGMEDLSDGYSYPFLQERKVSSFETINYNIVWHKRQVGLNKWCELLTSKMGENYVYEMVTAHDRAVRIMIAEEGQKKAGVT